MMSFGFSPSDVVKLVQVSTRVYLAFKGESGRWKLLLGPLADSAQMPTTIQRPRYPGSCASSPLSINVC
jgi:hypothetical protein